MDTSPLPVHLTGHPDRATSASRLASIADRAAALAVADVTEILDWVRSEAGAVPLPAGGATGGRWEWLATVAAQDLTVARAVEPHLDAVAILTEAHRPELVVPGSTWGVYAAESPRLSLEARREGRGGRWLLSGTKPWCSLAGDVSHALVTAWVDSERRAMFAVSLDDPGVDVDAARWGPAGLARVTTSTVTMTDVPGDAVGGPGWYLERPGFAWGGIGVAAAWFGGTVALARRLEAGVRSREPDQIALMHLGAVDADLAAAAALLDASARSIDGGVLDPTRASQWAARTRQVVADAAERTLARVGHALGPAPLAQEPAHVGRVADLTLYLRQHHAERDAAASGGLALQAGTW